MLWNLPASFLSSLAVYLSSTQHPSWFKCIPPSWFQCEGNARPEEIHLRSFQALSCSSLSPWRKPSVSPLPQCPGLSRIWPPGIMIPVAAPSSCSSSRPTSNKLSLLGLYSGFRQSGHVLFGCQAHPCGSLFRTALSLQLLGSAPPLPPPGPLLCLRFHSAAFPTDWPPCWSWGLVIAPLAILIQLLFCAKFSFF